MNFDVLMRAGDSDRMTHGSTEQSRGLGRAGTSVAARMLPKAKGTLFAEEGGEPVGLESFCCVMRVLCCDPSAETRASSSLLGKASYPR